MDEALLRAPEVTFDVGAVVPPGRLDVPEDGSDEVEMVGAIGRDLYRTNLATDFVYGGLRVKVVNASGDFSSLGEFRGRFITVGVTKQRHNHSKPGMGVSQPSLNVVRHFVNDMCI